MGELREWQQPLSEEKVAWLVKQFAIAKTRIEEVWGYRGLPPWSERTADE